MSDLNHSPEFEEKVRKALSVPNAKPEFVDRLRNELVRRPVKMKPQLFKPAWAVAFVLVFAILVVSAPTLVAAFGKIFGYVPGVGLVETTNGIRMLKQPVVATRDGVTLTVTNVFVYEDRIELKYEVSGIAPENDGWQAADLNTNPTAFCGGVNPGSTYNSDGDARLRLPDGSVLERDYTGKYPQNVFAMQPVYEASIPNDVTELFFMLKCIPQARLGAVPENWEIYLELVEVPAGTIVGEPVIEVTQPALTEEVPASSSTEVVPAPKVTMTLERIVPTDTNTVLYVHFNMENADPSLISIMPQNAYVIDSLGQQIPLRGGFVWQPFEHKVGSAFEFVTESKPAEGALTVVVDQVVAYYMPMYTEPPQATPEEMTFTFDAGANPQYGQKWDLNVPFTIAGFDFEIASTQAVKFEDVAKNHNYIDGSQGYEYGYQFVVTAEPSLNLIVEMDIRADQCWLSDVYKVESEPLVYTQLCKNAYPTGQVSVTIREMSITILDDIRAEWMP